MKKLSIISFTDTPGKTAIHQTLFDSVSSLLIMNVKFFLAYDDMRSSTINSGLIYVNVGRQKKALGILRRYLKIPIVREVVIELVALIQFLRLRKHIPRKGVDLIITNVGMKGFTKYFASYCKRRYGTVIITYIYGIGLRNPTYRRLTKAGLKGIHPRKNFISDSIRIFEQVLQVLLLDFLGLVRWREYSKFHYGYDYMLVKSVNDRRKFLENGIPGHKIRVIGSVWDYGLSRLRGEKEDPESVLIVSQPFHQLLEERKSVSQHNFARLLDSLGKKTGYIKVTVKLHPRESLADFNGLVANFPWVRWVSHLEEDTQQLVARAGLVISQCSTVILDAIALGKSFLFFEFEEGFERPFMEYDGLFKNPTAYDLSRPISYNFKLAEAMEVDIAEYSRWVQPVDLPENFGRFLADCLPAHRSGESALS